MRRVGRPRMIDDSRKLIAIRYVVNSQVDSEDTFTEHEHVS